MKTCTKCGEIKPLDQFWPAARYRLGVHSHCKVCALSNAKAWRNANPERVAELAAKSQAKTREKVAESHELQQKLRDRAATYAATEKGRATRTERARRDRERLSDWYVRATLLQGQRQAGQSFPAELLQLRREQLSLQRLAKSLQQAAKENTHESSN